MKQNSLKLLCGICPVCRGTIKEIELELDDEKRVICLDCKNYGDGSTWGQAYKDFLLSID